MKEYWIIERVGAEPPWYLQLVVRSVGGKGLALTHVIGDALRLDTQEGAQARIDALVDTHWCNAGDLQPVLWKT